MIKKIKAKARNILVSIIAFLLVSPCLLINSIFAQGDPVNTKQRNTGNFEVPPPVYGIIPTKFNPDLVTKNKNIQVNKVNGFSGIIISKETGQPLSGIILGITGTNERTITNRTGIFKFPAFYTKFNSKKNIHILEIKDANNRDFFQTKEIQINNNMETIEISL